MFTAAQGKRNILNKSSWIDNENEDNETYLEQRRSIICIRWVFAGLKLRAPVSVRCLSTKGTLYSDWQIQWNIIQSPSTVYAVGNYEDREDSIVTLMKMMN